jgi:hypothetical protein
MDCALTVLGNIIRLSLLALCLLFSLALTPLSLISWRLPDPSLEGTQREISSFLYTTLVDILQPSWFNDS